VTSPKRPIAPSRHLLARVDDVLELSSAQGGAISVVWADVDPLAAAADCGSMLEAQAASSGLRFDLATAVGSGLRVRADKRRLSQVLGNLLSNAIRYNRRGGSISVKAEACGASVRISVADDGLGMDAAQLERLIDPFDRLGAQHTAVPGSGLGLSLSRQLVQAMGGELTVASLPGGGSTFTVTLQAAATVEPHELPAILPET